MNKKLFTLSITAVVFLAFMGACSTKAVPTALAAAPAITMQEATTSYCGAPNPMPTAAVAHYWAVATMKAANTYTITSVKYFLRAQSNTTPSGSMWVEIQGVDGGGFPDGIALPNGVSSAISAGAVNTASHSETTFEFNNCSVMKDQLISVVYKADQDWDVSFGRTDACPYLVPNNFVGYDFFVDDPWTGVHAAYAVPMMFIYGY